VLEADSHGLKSCQVYTQSVFSISKSHNVSRLILTLGFGHPPLGLKYLGLNLWELLCGFLCTPERMGVQLQSTDLV
jgi:hypothetical protein